jgi:hypothetical protein
MGVTLHRVLMFTWEPITPIEDHSLIGFWEGGQLYCYYRVIRGTSCKVLPHWVCIVVHIFPPVALETHTMGWKQRSGMGSYTCKLSMIMDCSSSVNHWASSVLLLYQSLHLILERGVCIRYQCITTLCELSPIYQRKVLQQLNVILCCTVLSI